jgi:hypothetical protein
MIGEDYMHKLKLILIVLAIVVLSATSFECIAQGQVTSFNTYKSCVDDSDCGDDGYCVNGRCQRGKEEQGCVDDSDCGTGRFCVNGRCQRVKEKQDCVDDSDCLYGGYCIMGICRMKKGWW